MQKATYNTLPIGRKHMKHIKKNFQKISKEMMKKGVSTLVILFFAMVMIFQKDTSTTEIQFVRNSDAATTHNAANQQRDYLFQDTGGQQTYQGTIGTGTTTGTTTASLDALINPNDVAQIINDIKTGALFTGNMNTGIQISQKTGTISVGSLDCTTPWGEKVKNKDFVLGYQQRKDVNTICNIEKRVCIDGTLGGSFNQSSCKEDVVYVYKKAEVVSYNQKVLNEYIQPSAPANAGSDFTNQGKINTTGKVIDNRRTTNNPVVTQSGITQNQLPSTANCLTPRGQQINHGQFVKAYKAPRGFIDLPCDVEIRACVNGNLKGTFIHAKCTFNNTSYADYIKAGSPAASTGFLFFQRIKSAFRRG